jgi:hypothetical protein
MLAVLDAHPNDRFEQINLTLIFTSLSKARWSKWH